MTGTIVNKVTGPGAAVTDNAVPRFDLTTGNLVQGSSVIIDDTGNITGVSTIAIATDITHTGDADNKITFGADTQSYETGGTSRLDISDSGVRMGAANARVTTVLDEGDLVSDSSTALATQASIKTYVDKAITVQEYKKSVFAASTAALTVTYDNGASGVGATLTNAGAQAVFELDGINPLATNRVLIKDQAAPAQNGVYTVTDVGSGATNWVLTRATDYDHISEMDPGVLVTVDAGGTVHAVTSFMQTTTVATIGTDAVTYSQFTYDTTFPILDIDNIRINGNTIISSDTDGNLNYTPNGTGLNVLANAQVTNVTASRAVVTDASSNLNESATTATEIGYISGLTSAVQTQLDSKATSTLAVTQATHGFSAGDILYLNAGTYTKAIATSAAAAEVIGYVLSDDGTNDFTLAFSGHVTVGLSGLTTGAVQYLSTSSAGDLTETKPTTATQVIKPLMIATSASTAVWNCMLGVLL